MTEAKLLEYNALTRAAIEVQLKQLADLEAERVTATNHQDKIKLIRKIDNLEHSLANPDVYRMLLKRIDEMEADNQILVTLTSTTGISSDFQRLADEINRRRSSSPWE